MIEDDATYGIVQHRMHGTIVPHHRIVHVSAILLADLHRVGRLIRIALQVLLIQPAFHTTAPLVGLNDAHRDIQRATHQAREEIARSTGVLHRLIIHHLPVAVGIVLGMLTNHAGHLHMVNASIPHGICHHIVVALHGAHVESLHRHFHIALSCSHPHLTREDAIKRELLPIVEGDAQLLEAGLRRVYSRFPVALSISLSCANSRTPRNRHLDGSVRGSLAPETSIRILL